MFIKDSYNNEFVLFTVLESWGSSFYITERNGNAFCRLYNYKDDKTVLYLADLGVDQCVRRLKLATRLLEAIETVFNNKGIKEIYLWVDKDSWMHDWYKRLGYKDFANHEFDESFIWMKKRIN